jgi:hypothetical protein
MRREELKKFATLFRVNAEYNYLRQSTLNTIIAKQKCDDQIWMNGKEFFKVDGLSSPPPQQGGGNRPRPPSPFSSSGKDKDWSHPPMMVVEEE